MSWATSLSWWAGFRSPHGAAPHEADPAEMGTAFGLDASFGPAEPEPAPRPDAPAAAPVPWEHRLTRRSCL